MKIYNELSNLIKDDGIRDAIRQRVISAQLLNKADYSVDKIADDLNTAVFNIVVISSGYYTDNMIDLVNNLISWLYKNDDVLKKYVDIGFYNTISHNAT